MTVRFGGHTYESGSAMKSSRESAEESNRNNHLRASSPWIIENSQTAEAELMSKQFFQSDGFLDLKIFIKLLILEMKLIIFPKIPSVKEIAKYRKQTANPASKAQSPPSAFSKKMTKARSMFLGSKQLSNFSGTFLNNLNDSMINESFGGFDSQRSQPVMIQDIRTKSLERLYEFFIQQDDLLYDDSDTVIVQKLSEEISNIKALVNTFMHGETP